MAAWTGGRRVALWFLILAGTALLLAAAVPRAGKLGDTAGLLPPDDPYVRLNREITATFGMETPVIWVVEARHGSVWTRELLTRVQLLTRQVFKIPGVVPTSIISLASPNLRDVEFTETGGMRPVYLMGEVPDTPEGVEALRRRVEGDPNYRGNLTSLDGRAAMIVADFRTDSDPEVVASRANELKEEYTDDLAAVRAAGAPLLARVPPGAIGRAAIVAAGIALLGVLVSAWLLGAGATLRIGFAGALAAIWAGSAVVMAGLAALPWTVYALPSTALMAAVIALTDQKTVSTRLCVALGVALLVASGALVLVTAAPARAMGLAAMAGAVAAVLAGSACRTRDARRPLGARWGRKAAFVLVILSTLGLLRLNVSLGLAGYGQRYPLGSGAADLRVIARHFPPPTALVVRARGEKGFVKSPDVLRAFDGAVKAAREDHAVVSAMSLADIVKMVSWAFNEKREEFLVIPDDPRTIGRYLVLGYSPGFGRFVDRALSDSAMWVYVRGDSATDLARVLDRVETQLARQPPPNTRLDFVGGDGAEILVMARTARHVAAGGAAGLLAMAALAALFGGAGVGARALLGGAGAVAVSAGILGLLGLPLDLITLPLSIANGLVGAAFGALGGMTSGRLARLGIVLMIMAVPLLLIPYAGGQALGALMLGAATASWVSTRSRVA